MGGPFGPWFDDAPKDGWDSVQASQGRFPGIIDSIERLERRRQIEDHLRIAYTLRDDELVVSVAAKDLWRFYAGVVSPMGEYRPRFDAAYHYGSGEIRVEFTFEP